MAKLTIGQKSMRVLKFLTGLRHPRVAAAIERYGFSDAQLKNGWELLSAVSRTRMGQVEPFRDPRVISQLDDFENIWFPIAKATLEHHYPDVAEILFRNLSQTEGLGVAVTVGMFLERIDQMEQGQGEFAENGHVAREVLRARGLDNATVAQAQALIEKLQSVREPPQATREEAQKAEDALWAWYLEWSAIARIAVHDRRLLRAMGFLQSRRPVEEEVEETEASEEPTEVETASPSDEPAEAPSPPAQPSSSNGQTRSNGQSQALEVFQG